MIQTEKIAFTYLGVCVCKTTNNEERSHNLKENKEDNVGRVWREEKKDVKMM